MRKRKFLSMLLAFAMIITFIPSSASAADYSDIAGHWCAGEISNWSDRGIVSGNNGSFRPNEPITRGEMAKIIDKIMKYQVKAENKFDDLDQSWYTDAILRVNSAGVMTGSGSMVRPTDNITRQEAVVMLCRALGIQSKNGNTNFADEAHIGSWAKGYVNALVAEGYLAGVGDNRFAPDASITRASVVKLLDNAVKGLFDKSGEYTGDVNGNVIINSSGVTLKNMHISGSLIIAEGVGNGKVDLDNLSIDGDVIVRGGGENSVYFNSVTVDGSLVVNKVDGAVRIVATGKTSVSLVTLESGAILVTKELAGGGIEKVEIPAALIAGQKIVLEGNFKTVENNAVGLGLSASGKIDSLVLNAKTTVSGGATIAQISVSKGTDSVVNGKTVSDSTGITPPTGGSSSGSGGGGNGSEKFTVTFDSNGGSLVSAISGISKGDHINLPANPTKEDASFLGWFLDDGSFLTEFTASTPITANLIVYAKWSGWQEPAELDSRFAAGYPKASVGDDGRIQLEIKLMGASISRPMEVFMVVNAMNPDCPTDATAVVHGHVGTQDEVVYADEAPYIRITDENSHRLITDVSVSDARGIDIFFVIRDQSSTSKNPTMLTFDPVASAELDQYAPWFESAYLNESKNKIYLHFDEVLDPGSVPDSSAFTLIGGSIADVEVSNPERNQLGRVILSIYDVEDDTEALEISYNPPETDALQDKATEPNQVEDFSGNAVMAGLAAKGISISSTGKYIALNIENSLYFWNDEIDNGFDVTVTYGADQASATVIEDFNLNYSFRTDGSDMIYFIELYDDSIPELKSDGKFYITLKPQEIAVDFAGDAVTESLTFEGAPRATEAGVVPTARYNASKKELTLTFDEDHGLADKFFAACLFQIQSGGRTYVLRAFTSLDADSGTIVLSDTHHNLPFDAEIFDWEGATISFSLDTHPDIQVYQRLNYDSGMPYQGFNNIDITVE